MTCSRFVPEVSVSFRTAPHNLLDFFFFFSCRNFDLVVSVSSQPPKEVCCGLHPLMNQRGVPALVQAPAASSWPTPFQTVPSTREEGKHRSNVFRVLFALHPTARTFSSCVGFDLAVSTSHPLKVLCCYESLFFPESLSLF
jgi:hypothetical protein